MRLAKYLAHAGVASRRAAEELIRAGRVSVMGETVTDPARDVDDTSNVIFDGEAISHEEPRVVFAVHKPAGVVSTAADTHGRPTVVGLVNHPARLYPVGRLDADTTGLILLTNDGALANTLTHPRYEVQKVYRATVAGAPTDAAIAQLRTGVDLEDGRTSPARVRRLRRNMLEIVLIEGRKRQVRRMCEAVGHRVIALERVRFGPLELGGLDAGKSRRLTAREIAALERASAKKD